MKKFDEYYQLVTNQVDRSNCNDFYQKIFIVEKKFNIRIEDRYSNHSKQYVLKDNNKIIAAYRIIPGSSEVDFPVGEFCKMPFLNKGNYAEFSRLAIHPDYRRGVVSLKKTFIDLRRHGEGLGITHFIGEPTLDLVTFYERFGFKPYGKPFYDPSIISERGEYNSILIVASLEDLPVE